MLDQAVDRLNAYLAAIMSPVPLTDEPWRLPTSRAPHDPDTVQAGDGSIYPAAVAGDLPDLPPRVRPGSSAARTVGVAYLDGHRVGVIVSGHRDPRTGQPDPYVARAHLRLAACGRDQWNAHHVEAKLVARMIESNIRQGEVNLNNVPCGYETTIVGCHQVLADMLPFGSSLRVRGTYGDGTMAFDRVYRGRGPA
ncbi:MAG TPA: DddA-like double-stranded DNA deaminase toxin [Pseudonocardiaceae bacterium]